MDRSELERVRKIVSHDGCPDGIASALILQDVLPEAEVAFFEHNTPELEGLAAEPGMLFCDIAPPRDRASEFVDAGAIVLDHHRAAKDVVTSFGDRGVFADEAAEPGVSGALLAYREVWRRFHDEDDPDILRFATLAGIRDTWQRDSPDWDRACEQSTTLTFFGFDAIDGPALPDAQLDVGRRLLAKRAEITAETAAKKWLRMRDDVAIYNDRDRLLSDVAARIFEHEPAIQLVCGFFYKVVSDGRMLLVFALRSRKDGVDVAAIAKRNGGGGHTSAAGFSQPVTADAPNPVEAFRAALDG
jgi:hypothetical protein